METSTTPGARALQPRIYVTDQDWRRLNELLSTKLRELAPAEGAGLDAELARADVVPPRAVPHDVVTMNTRVRFELDDGRSYVRTLVYPWDADPERGCISVLSPLGNALLGLSVGDAMPWPLPSGQTVTVRVLEVLYQPEARGDFHL